MPDSDIPKGFEGEFSFVVILAGETPGRIIVRERDFEPKDIVTTAEAKLGKPVAIMGVIHGISAMAASILHNKFDAVIIQAKATRRMFLELLNADLN